MLPERPHQTRYLLLFDPAGCYAQPLADALSAGKTLTQLTGVETAEALQAQLAKQWDTVFIAYAALHDAQAVLRHYAPQQTYILLHHPAEEAQAALVTDEQLSDLLCITQLHRLPLILRRERQWQASRVTAQQFAHLATRFQAVIEGFGDAILIIDAHQLIRYANPAFERSFGHVDSQTLGKPFVALLHPTEQAAFQEAVTTLGHGVGTLQFNHRLQQADGTWAFTETTGQRMADPEGQSFAVLHLRDCTERKVAEEAVRQSERRLRLFVEHAPAAIAMLDREMRYVAVSRRWLADFQIHDIDLIGRSHYAVFPELPEHWYTIHQRCLQGAIEKCEADPFPRADGTVDWVRWEVHPWHNDQGEIGGIVFFSEVITERIQTEAALRESNDWVHLAIEISNLGKWQHDIKAGVIRFDERACHHYGFATPTVPFDLALQRIHPEDRQRLATEIASTLDPASNGRHTTEYRVIHSDGSIHWLAVEAQVYFTGEGAERQPVRGFGTSQEITARKQAEADEHERRLLAEAMRDSLVVLTSSLDVETVMRQLLAVSARVVPSEAGAIVLFANGNGQVAYSRGHTPEAQAFFATKPILFDSRVYNRNGEEQVYYLAADTRATPGWVIYPQTEWVRSSVGVQIVLHGQPIGFLTADSASPNQYQQKDVEKLQAFARYAALALENAHHVDQLEQRVQERTAALEAAKTQVEAILHNSPDAILLINTDLTIERKNHAFRELFHCTSTTCYYQSFTQLVHPADSERVIALIQAVIAQHQSQRVEIRARRHDGTIFDAELSIGAVQSDGLVCILHDITERKAQERQLRYHASLQAAVSEAVIVTDMETKIQSWNVGAERVYGWQAAEVIGHKVGELLHTHIADEERQMVLAQLRAQGWWQQEVQQYRKDGSLCYILSSVTLIRDDAGNATEMVAVNYDLTKRKQMEDALRESEARYRLLAENITDLVVKLTPDGIRTFVTPSCYALLGYRPEELIGQPAWEMLHPTDVAQFQAGLEQARNSPQATFTLTHRVRHKAGHYRWAETVGTLVRNPATGMVEEIVKVMRDITERKQAAEALQQYATEVHDLYNNAPCGYHSLDEDGLIVQINDTELAWLGYRRDEVVGKLKVTDLVTPESAQKFQACFPSFKARGWVNDLEFDFICKTGAVRHFLLNSTAMYSEAGHYLQSRSTVFDITELRRAQQTIAESEARYRLLAENVIDLISRYDVNGRITFVTPSCYTLTGYRPEEMLGQNRSVYIHPEDLPQSAAVVAAAFNAGAPSYTVTNRLRHKAGHYLWVESSVTIGRDANTGAITEFIAVTRDITKRQQAEAALRASEEKFRQVAENFDQILFIRSADNQKILYINSASERLAGVARTAMLANPQIFLNYIHPEDREYVRQQQQSAAHLAGGRIDVEYRFVRPDGPLRWFRARTFPIKSDEGIIVSRVVIVEDVTERKQAALALQESEANYRRLVETMRGGLVIFNAENKMTYVNDRFCELLGRRRAELLGTSPFDHLDLANRALVEGELERRRHLEDSTYEMVVQRPDGQLIHLLSQGSPLRDKGGHYSGGFAIVTDISAQKQAEATLRQALAKERELGELKSRFVSIASHEFRTPLATISATTETLLTYYDRLDSTQFNARLKKILVQVGHMKEIMEDVLQLARIQAGRIDLNCQPGDLAALCQEVIDEYQERNTDDGQRIICQLENAPVQFSFDARLMRHVISNLISNGLKYSPAAKPVYVELRATPDAMIFRVVDQGIGIPSTDVEHIFEPFHRAHNVGSISGTGLGLSITKEAIQMHGGNIQIDTQVDLGTTVTVTLPTHLERGAHLYAKDSNY